jgi:sugar phosphate isomerase/epimerase
MSAQTTTQADRYSRRDLGLFTIAGLAAPLWRRRGMTSMPARTGGALGGVWLGVQASCFRDLPLESVTDRVDRLIHAMAACDATECELSTSAVEPAAFAGGSDRHHATMASMSPQMMRRELRKWRLRTPMGYFEAIGDRFRQAGIRLYAYNYSPDTTFSDEEIDRGFSMAKALGAEVLTVSSTAEVAPRVAPFADKHRMVVAFSDERRLSASPFVKLHADIGQLIANNVDPVAYLRNHHADIVSLYLSDCRKGSEETVVWGAGDAPIRQILQLLKREEWPVHAYVKCESRGQGTQVEEVKRCVAFARQALA